MKTVLIVFHGMPPIAGRTVVGSGLRAFANGEALSAAGHRVVYCTRHEDLPDSLRAKAERLRDNTPLLLTAITGPVEPPGDRRRGRTAVPSTTNLQDDEITARVDPVTPRHDWTPSAGLAPIGGPLGAPGNPFAFTDTHELHAVVAQVDPDVVLVEALEEARRLPDGRWTVVLDLFAPRILEQQFQAGASDPREAVRVLDALQRADQFLFSNQRQKYFHLPLLALAGVDLRADAGAVVPISCPPDFPPATSEEPLHFVAGGVFWPWADVSDGLVDLLGVLDDADVGTVDLYGGKYDIRSDTQDYVDPRSKLPQDHARLTFKGLVPIDQLWDEYRRAGVAFDLMARNPERELNLSFRQVDYLRCGLPIITAPGQVIADDLEEYGAGWLVEPGDKDALRALIRRLSAHPEEVAAASAAAQRLARERYSWDVTTGPLLDAVASPLRRQHTETLVSQLARTQADLWDEHETAKRLRTTAARQEADLDAKSEEIRAQDAKIRQLLSTVDRLTLSLEEVSRFRTDTVTYLQQEEDAALREAAELQRELDRRDLDLRKKQAALDAADREIDKLKSAVEELQEQNAALQGKYADKDGALLAAEERARGLTDRVRGLESELASKRREVEGKSASVHRLVQRLQAQEATFLDRLAQSENAARELLSETNEQLNLARAARGRAEEEATSAEQRASDLATDLLKKEDELQAAQRKLTLAAAETQRSLDAAERRQAEALAIAEERSKRVAEVGDERLREELAKAARSQERAIERLQAQGRAEAEAVEAAHLAALESAEDRWRDELRLAEQRHTQESDRAEQRHRSALARLRAEQEAALQRQDDRATDRHRSELDRLRAEHEAALTRLEDQHLRAVAQVSEREVGALTALQERAEAQRQRELEATRREGAAQLEQLRRVSQRQLDQAREAADAVLTDLLDRSATIGQERDALKARLEETTHRAAEVDRRARAREQELKQLETRHAAELERLRARQAELNADAEDRLLAARATTETVQAELDALRSSETELRARVQSLQADAAKKGREAAAARAQAEAATARATREIEELRLRTTQQLETASTEATALLRDAERRLTELAGKQADLRTELDRAARSGLDAEARHRVATDALQAEVAELEGKLDAARLDADKKAREAAAARARAEAEVARASRELDALRLRAEQQLETASAEATALLRDAEARISELATERGALRRDLDRMTQRAADADQQLRARSAELRQLETSSRTEEERLRGEHASSVADSEERIRALRTELETARAAADASVATSERLEGELAITRVELRKKQDELDALHTHTAEEQRRLDEEQARTVASLESRLQSRIADLEADVAKKTRALDEAARLRTELEERFLALITAAEEEVRLSLEAADASARRQALEAQDRLDAARAERDEARAALDEAEFERRALAQEVEKKSRQVLKGTEKLEATRAKLDDLQLQVANLTTQVEQKDYAVRSLSADGGKKAQELASALAQRDALQADLDKAREEVQSVQSHRDTLQLELEKSGRVLRQVEAQRDAQDLDMRRLLELLDESQAALEQATLPPRESEAAEPDEEPPAPPTAEA